MIAGLGFVLCLLQLFTERCYLLGRRVRLLEIRLQDMDLALATASPTQVPYMVPFQTSPDPYWSLGCGPQPASLSPRNDNSFSLLGCTADTNYQIVRNVRVRQAGNSLLAQIEIGLAGGTSLTAGPRCNSTEDCNTTEYEFQQGEYITKLAPASSVRRTLVLMKALLTAWASRHP